MPESLVNFAALVADVWRTSIFGLDLSQVLIALAIFFVFFFLRGLASRFLFNVAARFARRTRTKIDDYLVEALLPPARFFFIVAGLFFAAEYLQLEGTPDRLAEQSLRSLVVVVLFWALHNAADLAAQGMERLARILSDEIISWATRALRWAVIILGAAAVLQIWGIEVGPLIAGLGLFGLAVALGAQDLFKNLLAGLSILLERRFHKGDWIKVEGVVEGTVAEIGFRSTRINRFDSAPVTVPNTVFSDNAVTNFSAMSHRRIYWQIGVEYRTTVPQLREIRDKIEAYIRGNDAFDLSQSLFVRVEEFSDSAITLMLYCFTKTTRWGEWLAIKEELAYAIKQIVEQAGSGFAFPSRSLYIETLPGEGAEIFAPPRNRGGEKA